MPSHEQTIANMTPSIFLELFQLWMLEREPELMQRRQIDDRTIEQLGRLRFEHVDADAYGLKPVWKASHVLVVEAMLSTKTMTVCNLRLIETRPHVTRAAMHAFPWLSDDWFDAYVDWVAGLAGHRTGEAGRDPKKEYNEAYQLLEAGKTRKQAFAWYLETYGDPKWDDDELKPIRKAFDEAMRRRIKQARNAT